MIAVARLSALGAMSYNAAGVVAAGRGMVGERRARTREGRGRCSLVRAHRGCMVTLTACVMCVAVLCMSVSWSRACAFAVPNPVYSRF